MTRRRTHARPAPAATDRPVEHAMPSTRTPRALRVLPALLALLGACAAPDPPEAPNAPPPPVDMRAAIGRWGLTITAVVEVSPAGVGVDRRRVAPTFGDAPDGELIEPRIIEPLGAHLAAMERSADAPIAIVAPPETPFWQLFDAAFTAAYASAGTVAFIERTPAGPGISFVSVVPCFCVGPRSDLRLHAPRVDGPCRADHIARIVRGDQPLLEECTAHRAPAVGEARIEWRVDETGRVGGARVSPGGVHPLAVTRCWQRVASGWRVDPPPPRPCVIEQRLTATLAAVELPVPPSAPDDPSALDDSSPAPTPSARGAPHAGLMVRVTPDAYHVSSTTLDLTEPRFGDAPIHAHDLGVPHRDIDRRRGAGAERALYALALRVARAAPGDRRVVLSGSAHITFGDWMRAAEVMAHRRASPRPDGGFGDDVSFGRARVPLDRGRPGVAEPLFDHIVLMP